MATWETAATEEEAEMPLTGGIGDGDDDVRRALSDRGDLIRWSGEEERMAEEV